MKKIAMVLVIGCIILGAKVSLAGETDVNESSWVFQIGYSPLMAAVFGADEDGEGVAAALGPVHGGSLSVDWRGKGRWGVQVPMSYHKSKDGNALGLGANAVCHFRGGEKRVDPYLLLGGKIYIAFGKDGGGVLPAPSLGFGLRGFFSKKIGIFVEAAGNGLPVPGGAVVIVEGRAGVSIRF